jgi:hypothetical protein
MVAPGGMLKAILMKFQIFALFTATIMFCGCSSPKFTANHGSEVIQGLGGSNRAVDGIDFWEDGTPLQKYRVLGTIDENHDGGKGLSAMFGSDRDEAIAKIARQQGGDAVIVAGAEASTQDEQAHTHQRLKLLTLIKYVN